MSRQLYVICSDKERGFWSNSQGWVFDVASADKFSAFEVGVESLPSIGVLDCKVIMVQNAKDYAL